MLNISKIFFLTVIYTLFLTGCGGGKGSNLLSDPDKGVYKLLPVVIPISSQDVLVTTTISLPANIADNNYRAKLFNFISNFFLTSAIASSATLTISATSKITNGAVAAVNPIFTTLVPDKSIPPTRENPNPMKKVSVICDIASLPLTVNINYINLLDKLSKDILVNMSYPASVRAYYNYTTEKFSACSYEYSTGNFIVYGDQTVGEQLDNDLGGPARNGKCLTLGKLPTIIPKGDSNRNTSSFVIISDFGYLIEKRIQARSATLIN